MMPQSNLEWIKRQAIENQKRPKDSFCISRMAH